MPEIDIEGKPQLFFSSNNSDKPWRLIEKIVAIVESYFQNTDVYTFSSIRIPNVVGDPTEVDIAYSSVPNPTDIYRFVQVRDRHETQGRPWIEQILGQQQSLDIHNATMVSTEPFSGTAVRLAKGKNINLRLLLPETEGNIKQWYKPDSIGVHRPLSRIVRAVIVAKSGERFGRFDADATKSTENNILVKTQQPGQYKVVSIARVFDVEVMRDSARSAELLRQVPLDLNFHKAVVGIEYQNPHLFLKVIEPKETDQSKREQLCPITGMTFVAEVSKQVTNHPISYRYKYMNALKNTCIAQTVVSRANLTNQESYICLVRHHIDADKWSLGGAFFQ
jgi:hypothetical protein